MERNPASADERLAYYQAGMAVVAHEYGIRVNRLMLDGGVGARPSLMKFDEWCKQRARTAAAATERIEDYVTTLLAASVGRLLVDERAMGYPGRCTGQARLERGALARVRQGGDLLADRACYLAFMWLSHCDGGDADVTVSRLWKRADEFLRPAQLRSQLVRLAARLLEVREMYRGEIEELLRQ